MADTNLLILAREFKALRTRVQEVLKMPVGPQGLQGEKGEQGATGDQGATPNLPHRQRPRCAAVRRLGAVPLPGGDQLGIPNARRVVKRLHPKDQDNVF